MRVYFIHSGLEGCYLVRSLLPLSANGWDGDQTSIVSGHTTPENKAIAAQASDVVVFHRPEGKGRLDLAKILKEEGKKVVFDNDDTYKDSSGIRFNDYINEERAKKGLERINENIDSFIKIADLVTCSTKFLAEEYKKLNPNVIVLPNCIDPFYFDEPIRNETDIVRIGVTGSIAISNDLEVLIPILKHYHKDKRVKLVLFSLPPEKDDTIIRQLYKSEYEVFDSVDIEWQPFVPLHEYFDKLNNLKLDIMIIPREDNYFNRCKSNLKFLEASMFEIPVIAQGFPDGQSPYQQDPDDADHMKIVTDNKDWIPAIEVMIVDKDGRREQGRKAREYVLNKYDIEKNAHLWREAYQNLLKK